LASPGPYISQARSISPWIIAHGLAALQGGWVAGLTAMQRSTSRADLVQAGSGLRRRRRGEHGRVDLLLRRGVGGHFGRRQGGVGRLARGGFGGLAAGGDEGGHGQQGDNGPAHPGHSDRSRSATIGMVRGKAKGARSGGQWVRSAFSTRR
jgi:hypothetical protein